MDLLSHKYAFDVDEKDFGVVNFLNYEQGGICTQSLRTPMLRSGKWETCQVNEDTIIVGSKTLVEDMIEVENISNEFKSISGVHASSKEELQLIIKEIGKKKQKLETAVNMLSSNKALTTKPPRSKTSMVEFTLASKETDEKFNINKQMKVIESFSHPYGVDRIINTSTDNDDVSYTYNVPFDYEIFFIKSFLDDINGVMIKRIRKEESQPFVFYEEYPEEEDF